MIDKNRGINVLSLFDGMSCWYEALTRAGIKIDNYFASEIDRYAIQISKKNHPDIINVGSVTDIKYYNKTLWFFENIDWRIQSRWKQLNIDLIIWGSPCQDLSIAKKDWKGLAGEKSWLFFEYVRLLKETSPKYFLLENVSSMKKEDKEEITRILLEIYPETECHMINSALVSAQNRKRLYWTNIKGITQPKDKWIFLKDIIEDIPLEDPKWKPLDEKYISKIKEREKSFWVTATYAWACPRDDFEKSNRAVIVWIALRNRLEWKQPEFNWTEKANSMTTVQTDSLVSDWYYWRKLTPIECERLQTLNDWYTEWVSNSQRYKMIGNGWTVSVIEWIFRHIKN